MKQNVRETFEEIFFGEKECDVLLIQPNVLQHTNLNNTFSQKEYWMLMEKTGTLFGDLPIEPNWGVLYVASALESQNYSVCYLDFHLYDYVKYKKTGEFITDYEINDMISRKKFKYVGITSMTQSHNNAIKIAAFCKSINPASLVILGGIHFSFIARETLESHNFIDAIIIGEGEDVFPLLLKTSKNRDQWNNFNGIAFAYKGQVVFKDKFNIIEDIDKLEFPRYELLPSDVPTIPRIYTSRGCDRGCPFCAVSNFFQKSYRRRSIDNVIREINYLTDTFKFSDFILGDLSFGADREYALTLCNFLICNNIKVRWWSQTRAGILDEELLTKMKEAGCSQLAIGIETGDYDLMKKFSVDKYPKNSIIDTCWLIKKHGISVQGYFMLGIPGETIHSAVKTIELIDYLTKNNLVDVTHISVMTPYPGTNIKGIEIENLDYNSYAMNADEFNFGLPVHKTGEISNYQLYSLWQLALDSASKNFKTRKNYKRPEMFKNLESFINSIQLKKYVIYNEKEVNYEH